MSWTKRITPDRAVLLGAVVAALAYFKDLHYDFILDDVPLILMNEGILSLRNWKTAFVSDIFSETHSIASLPKAIHYRPVYKLWQMLNERLFGSILPWWHLTSMLLHVVVIFLVYQLGVKLLKERWTAALASLLFAVHPIHAESVAYVTASTDLLVAAFTLVSVLAYLRFRQDSASPVYFAVSIFTAVLAMLSKESAVILPWLLVAYEAVRETSPGTERSWKRFLWTLPFFAVVAFYVAVRTLLFGLNSGPGPGGNRLAAFLDIPLVLVVYVRNLFWPARLSFYYPGEWGSQWTVLRGIAAALVIVAVGYLWNHYRERNGVRLQLLWAGILFAPALLSVYAFVREDWVHDRHMYLVSVPVCLVVAAILTDPKWPAKASTVASCAVLAMLLLDLPVQVSRFSDNATIYESAAKVAPRSLLLHSNYGNALWSYGRTEEASREFRIAAELAPQSPTIHEWYGGTLADLDHDSEAMAEFEKALDLSANDVPLRAFTFSRMAQLELKRSELPEAAAHLREAVKLTPENLNYHEMFSEVLSRAGRTTEAQEELRVEASLRQAARAPRASKD